MKTLFNYLLLTLFCSIIGQNALRAQDGYGGHWFLGLNGGAAWQQSDVKSILGGGGGFYLGKNVFYNEKAPLSFDLRFRYLGTHTYGQDFKKTDISTSSPLSNQVLNGMSGDSSKPNYLVSNGGNNFVFHNHKTTFHDLALEGRINFENLRRKNRIWLSLYGGVGVSWYKVAYDQLNNLTSSNLEYFSLYNEIDSIVGNSSETEIADRLIDGRDGKYETWMDGSSKGKYKAIFTPNVGFELGYWITKRFAIGVGHRVNWTFKDDFDGVVRGNGNNIHHYANLFMHFDIIGNSNGQVIRNTDHTNTPVVDRPTVDITTPNVSPFTTSSGATRVSCNIRNVETRSGVMVYVNNISVNNFSFNPNTDLLEVFVKIL
jgi:hypothetical protein